MNGLFVGGGSQHLDNHTRIDHAKPHCSSRELYKGILDGKSRGVFHGTILVRKDAQKTDAIQTNKNLLLSREALVNSTPALEIFADDVKCKHGSTIGQLDADALFYLRSRGIGEEDARALLTWAFAEDVARRIRIPRSAPASKRRSGLKLPGARWRAGKGVSAMSRTPIRSAATVARPRSAQPGPPYDVEAIRARLSDPRAARSTASPSSISTTPRRRRSRASVIDAERDVYERYYANIHRGVHLLSVESTDAYEAAREKVRALLNAPSTREIVFVRGTTEAINLVAQTYGRRNVGAGRRGPDHGARAPLEHRALADALRGEGREAPRRADRPTRRAAPGRARAAARARPDEDRRGRARLQRARHRSTRSARSSSMAHARGVPVLVDGAQAVPRMPVDVQALGCDFYAFSGHKVYGPTGVGVLWGRAALLEAMPPWQGGGDMISSVTFEKTTYNVLPYKFEAGTPNIAGAIGLGAAIDYVHAHRARADRARTRTTLLALRDGERSARSPACASSARRATKAAVLSFTIDGVHPHDIGTVLDRARRRGAHRATTARSRSWTSSASPPRRAPRSASTTRAQEVDALVAGIHDVRRMFADGADDRHVFGAARPLPGSDPRPRQAAAELPRARARRTARPRATTRSAATGRRCSSSSTATRSRDVAFQGAGCAISTASASMMTESAQGQEPRRSRDALRAFPRPDHRPDERPGRRARRSASSRSSRACASIPSASSARRCRGTRCGRR